MLCGRCRKVDYFWGETEPRRNSDFTVAIIMGREFDEMFTTDPEFVVFPDELFPTPIFPNQDPKPVSERTRLLGLVLDAGGPVRRMASAVVFADVS